MNPRTGDITVRGGVTVTDTLDSAVPGRLSVALDLSLEGERLFVLLVRDSGGIVTSSGDEPAGRSLKRFAAEEVDPNLALPVASHPGRLGADLPLVGYDRGELYAVPGATIVRVIEEPDIEGWCTRHATAAVEVRYFDKTYFVVLGDGNCEAHFSELGGRTPTLEATVAGFRANLEQADLE